MLPFLAVFILRCLKLMRLLLGSYKNLNSYVLFWFSDTLVLYPELVGSICKGTEGNAVRGFR